MSLVYRSWNIKKLSKPQISPQFFSFFLGSGIANVSSHMQLSLSPFQSNFSQNNHQLRPNLGEVHRFIWRISQAFIPRGVKRIRWGPLFFLCGGADVETIWFCVPLKDSTLVCNLVKIQVNLSYWGSYKRIKQYTSMVQVHGLRLIVRCLASSYWRSFKIRASSRDCR